MTVYIKNGGTYKPADNTNFEPELPVGNYIVGQDPNGNWLFESVDSFELNFKLYGDVNYNTERFMNTFLNREQSLGVLLSGEKGSGKSLLAKSLAIKAATLGMPTIIINQPYYGDSFNKLIQDIEQPCVILFDEFEKVYDREKQEKILTLLDGVFPTKKMFVLTCNYIRQVNSHLRNRPGRMHYFMKYDGIKRDFIIEYCDDVLNDKSHTKAICKLVSAFTAFNFDMLKALVAEMNMYNETPEQAMKYLNINFDDQDEELFDTVFISGKTGVETKSRWHGNPATDQLHFDDENDDTFIFDVSQLKSFDETGYVYEDDENNKLVFTRVIKSKFNMFL